MSTNQPFTLRLGTRGSRLARMQSDGVAQALEAITPGLRVESIFITTSGDQIQDRPLHDIGGKGLFTKEIERALLDGRIDVAVHSFKDVPVTQPLVEQSNLVFAAVPAREDARDVLVAGVARSIDTLPVGARVGTGSLRRRCQLLARRADLVVEMIRGNIDTRLRKLHEGQYDAIVLALAGLRRADLFDGATMFPIDLDQMVPSPGQGALAVQCRADDARAREILKHLNDRPTEACVQIERELVQKLDGDCQSPIAAFATVTSRTIELISAVGARGGDGPVVTSRVQADASERHLLASLAYDSLCEQGALGLLAR